VWQTPLAAAIGLALLAGPAVALTLELPAPILDEEERVEVPGSYPLPLGVFDGQSVPVRQVEGAIDQRAYRLDAPGLTTLAILAPLRDQIVAAGFQVVFDCQDRACGGFDFRYGTDILPEPDMHVDLGDFRFLSATRGEEAVTVLVSRSALSAFVQITRVSRAPDAAVPQPDAVDRPTIDLEPQVPDAAPAGGSASPVYNALDSAGTAVLEDLVFASGSASLAEGDYASLAAVAAWLEANPSGTIALVGHTDAAGSLAANIALSDRRAEAVAEVLVDRLGADRSRIVAEGVGFLSPIATNQTEEGRQQNRRVEVVVTSTN
jgi:outer membrane protein OmpA-like peptidoglycan-associated protein